MALGGDVGTKGTLEVDVAVEAALVVEANVAVELTVDVVTLLVVDVVLAVATTGAQSPVVVS